MRARRDALGPAERGPAEIAIHRHLAKLFDDIAGGTIASYAAIRSEVDLGAFHRAWSAGGGSIVLPRTLDEGTMEFVRFTGAEQMTAGSYGILEPVGDAVELAAIDAVIVPGLAFDATGGRLGYGAGYYDRFLSRLSNAREVRARFVGVGFDVQLVEVVPMADHDVHLDVIVTESGARARVNR
jgi:5-formyltetrahydrofolate cyclo-ligase